MSKVIFKPGWSAAPSGFAGTKYGPGLIAKLHSLADAQLIFTVANLCKYTGSVEISNSELRKITQLKRNTFYRSRKRLERLGVLDVEAVDDRHEVYRYRARAFVEDDEIMETAESTQDIKAEAIPQAVMHSLLNPAPDLRAAPVSPSAPIIDARMLPAPPKRRPQIIREPTPDPESAAPFVDPKYLPTLGKRRTVSEVRQSAPTKLESTQDDTWGLLD